MSLLQFAGVVVLLAGCGATPAPPPPFKPVADVRQLMSSVLEPAAETYWDAVGWIIDHKGEVEFAPKTNDEWEAVRNSAFVIAESGNLLMMDSRAMDRGDWIEMSVALVDAGRRALDAAEARNKQAVFDVGGVVYDACTKCHAKYAVSLMRPSARKE